MSKIVVLIRSKGGRWCHRTLVSLVLFWLASLGVSAADLETEMATKPASGLLMLNAAEQPLVSSQAERLLIPASTTKLVTGYLALDHWGRDYRFKTDFRVVRRVSDGALILWVKGYGDPFLVSEELQKIAARLASGLGDKGVSHLDAIYLDVGYFQPGLVLPGTTDTLNPYDAHPSALAANFNTLFLTSDEGEIVSAESQTPLTRLAVKIGHETDLSDGRFNLGPDVRLGQRYFAELLSAFLRRQGVTVADDIQWHPMTEAKGQGLKELLSYRHLNSLTLAQMVAPMMRYSTNFIANQLALKLAAEAYGAPATADKVQRLLNSRLKRRFGWREFYLEDGAGLSRENRLSARQLVDVLERFRPWKDLLPEVEPDIYAKTGTLIGVSALAGYIENDQVWSPFALLVNQKVPFHYRNQVALQLKQRLADEAMAPRFSQRPESYGSAN